MASIRSNPSKENPQRCQVMFRFADGKQGSRIWDDRASAERFRDHINGTNAEAALAALDEAEGRPEIATPTLASWLADYIENLGSGDVTEGTRQDYQRYLRRDIGPVLGEIRLGELTKKQVQDWVDGLPNGRKTIANKHSVLSTALNNAVEAGLITKNVAYRVKPAAILNRDAEGDDDEDDYREQITLTPSEFQVVYDAMLPHYRPMLEFLVETGCRFGEMAALRPRDIDWENGIVHFRRNIRRPHIAGANYTVGTVKTKRSERHVAVRRSLLDKLDRTNKYVFVNTVGSLDARGRHKIGTPGMVKINNFRTNVWRRRIDKLIASGALPAHKKVRLHDLRHTSASWLIDAGASPLEIQKRLGHKSITTTFNTYGHLFDQRNSDGKITAAFDRILGDRAPALRMVK